MNINIFLEIILFLKLKISLFVYFLLIFYRCITLDPNYGDSWAFAYKFELVNGNEEQQKIILEKCVAAEPHKGIILSQIIKITFLIFMKTFFNFFRRKMDSSIKRHQVQQI